MSELNGQMDLNSYLDEGTGDRAQGTGSAEGYDENGNLMDYEPEGVSAAAGTSSDPAEGGAPSPEGEGLEPQTSAEMPMERKMSIMEKENRLHTLAAEVRAIEEQVKGVALSGAVAIGKRLLEAKGLVPFGRFGEWLRLNVDYSERRAQDLMRLYETYGRGTIPESVSALDYSKAVALLSAPEEEREALAEAAGDMSVRELQAEIKKLKEDREKDQLTIDELKADNLKIAEDRVDDAATAARAIEDLQRDINTLRGTADAASRTAEALRKERDMAKANADGAARRAGDAVTRANETQAKLTEAEAKIKALEAREPERVEVVPPEVEAELERLRSAAPRGEAEVRFRLAFSRLGQEFKAVQEILAEVVREDADKGAKFAGAVVQACKSMIQMLGEASE